VHECRAQAGVVRDGDAAEELLFVLWLCDGVSEWP